MQTIALVAQKGGAGKTTLALNWAVLAQQENARVAVIDMDHQQSATMWYQQRQQERPLMLRATDRTIADAISVCRSHGMDWVFVDTMPRVEMAILAAVWMSDLVVVPCGPTALDIRAIASTIDMIRKTGKRGVIVVNQGRHSSNVNHKAQSVLQQYGLPVCPVPVMRRAAIADVFIDGSAITEVLPRSKAATEITASWQWIINQLTTSYAT